MANFRLAFGALAALNCAVPAGMALASGNVGACVFWSLVAVIAADIASS